MNGTRCDSKYTKGVNRNDFPGKITCPMVVFIPFLFFYFYKLLLTLLLKSLRTTCFFSPLPTSRSIHFVLRILVTFKIYRPL